MRLCLELARQARDLGEIPIGAVVRQGDEIIAAAHNETILGVDPSGHAEIIALRRAGQALGNHRLGGCTLYASIEPCAMCAGAMIQARIERLVYAAKDPRFGAFSRERSILDLLEHNHSFAVSAGLMAEEAAQLLQDFFRARR